MSREQFQCRGCVVLIVRGWESSSRGTSELVLQRVASVVRGAGRWTSSRSTQGVCSSSFRPSDTSREDVVSELCFCGKGGRRNCDGTAPCTMTSVVAATSLRPSSEFHFIIDSPHSRGHADPNCNKGCFLTFQACDQAYL